MTKACKIILVRHGESVFNKKGIIGGNSALTAEGKKQVRLTKKALAGFRFDEIYSSDRRRAVETAQIITGKEVPADHQIAGLRERDFGSLDHKSSEYREEEHSVRTGMTHDENWVYKHVPDTESDQEVAERFMQTLQELAEENTGKTILIAGHGGAIRVILMKLLGLTYRDLPQDSFRNAGYVELTYADNKFEVVQVTGVQL